MKAMLKEGAGLSNGLLCTLAVIAGVSVANLYYNQPLLDMLRQDLGTTTLAANHVALFSQLGYALGLLFIIPLADLFSRRRIVLVNFLLLAVSLLAIATASDIRVIHGFSLVTGVCSVIPQIFIPLAAQYSRPEYKNRNVGIVLSGLLTGTSLRAWSAALSASFSAGAKCISPLPDSWSFRRPSCCMYCPMRAPTSGEPMPP